MARGKRFEDKCYELVRRVPHGRVTTYSAVATALSSRAFRAVGNAMKKNVNPSVPCHRVVCSNGRLGGYNRGSATKAKILSQEGIRIKKGRVELSEYMHKFG